MKTILCLIAATTLFSSQLIAQDSKPGVRVNFHFEDQNGKPINEELVQVKVTFAKADADGNKVPVYIETFGGKTTSTGYLQREIGARYGDIPTVEFGEYSNVDFNDPKLWMQVEFKRTGFAQEWNVGTFTMITPVPVAAEALDSEDEDLDPENELQQLYKAGNAIYLTNGGVVELEDDDPTNELQTLDFSETTKMLTLSHGNTVDLSMISPFAQDSDGLFTDNDIEAQGFKTINGRTEIDPGKISMRYANGQDGIEMGIDEEFCAPFMTFIDCDGNTLGSFRMGPDGFQFYPEN